MFTTINKVFLFFGIISSALEENRGGTPESEVHHVAQE